MFVKEIAEDGVVFFKSTLLPCPHGFATRIGGVSREPHLASLNLAFGRGDERETVIENLKRFAKALGVPYERVVSVPQIHSSDVRKIDKGQAGQGYFRESAESFDGYVTDEEMLPVGVKTADCVPILFAFVREGRTFAVGAVHAGWRGTVGRIAERCVDMIASEYGAQKNEIFAAIGPAIHSCCYEVGEDFRRAVVKALGEDFGRKYVKKRLNESGGTSSNNCGVSESGGEIFKENLNNRSVGGELSDNEDGSLKYYADIVEMNREILISAGIPNENIDVSPLCTSCHPELFFSHRKSHGIRGTMCNIIAKDR